MIPVSVMADPGTGTCPIKPGKCTNDTMENLVPSNGRKAPQLVFYSGKPTWHPKQIAITFDDAPDNLYTPKILEILRKKKVKATFFIMGKLAYKYPNELRNIARGGHTIGNHSWGHMDFSKLTETQIEDEFVRTQVYITKITGKNPLLVRPPFGVINQKVRHVARKKGYRVIHWNIDTKDWDGRDAEKILSLIERKAYPGGIILLHAGGSHNLNGTVEALPKIIDFLKAHNYQMVTVDRLLHLQPYKR